MVGQAMVEDEYTINVVVRRPLEDDEPFDPPTITITPEYPVITLVPPRDSNLTYAHAAKSGTGAPPLMVSCGTLPRGAARATAPHCSTLPRAFRYNTGNTNSLVGVSLSKNLARPVYDEDDLPLVPPRRALPAPPSSTMTPLAPDTPSSTDGGSKPMALPVIQVFTVDNSHVATNTYTAPCSPMSQGSGGAGELYVPRITAHCRSDSGVLYVPPVDEHHLRTLKKDGPPAKGNSRRRKTMAGGEGRGGGDASTNAHWGPNSEVIPDVPPLDPTPEVVPPRTAASRAAARALLAGVLTPRVPRRSPSPPTPLTPRLILSPVTNGVFNFGHIGSPTQPVAPPTPPRRRYINEDVANNNRINQFLSDDFYNNNINSNNHANARTLSHALHPAHSPHTPVASPHTPIASPHTPIASPNTPVPPAKSQIIARRPAPKPGERVVEVYGGVGSPHPHPAPSAVSGRGSNEGRTQQVDPAVLTCLDLEADHHPPPITDMLVTDAPRPPRPHDLNHNNHAFAQKTPEGSGGRAAKYLVAESDGIDGHENYGYDSDILAGQDNYGYDPGYSSERSPDDEEGPPLYCTPSPRGGGLGDNGFRVAPGEIYTTMELMRLVPFITEGTIFEVTVIKNLRGLGLAVTGGIECDFPYAGLIRIKKLYPQTPAWLCGQLQVGDILLTVNDNPFTGLTSHEALEMLRITEKEVLLEVCRPPMGTFGEDMPDGGNSLGVVSTSLTAPTTSHNYLSPSPSFSSCGEFEIELTKVAGSLGFTLRKQDNSILGHTIRTLVKEPAISDGRLRPGDKIISVNTTDMCSLSHEEAIGFLRTCPETVTLKLYRDAMQTPVSPASPTEPEMMNKPKPLRKEARDMLSDLAFMKQTSSNSPSLCGATGSPGTPRRRRLQKTPSPDIKSVVIDRWDSLVRKTEESLPGSPTLENKTSLNSIRENDHEASPFGDSQTDDSGSTTIRSRNSSASSCSLTASNSDSRPKRPSFLDLSSGRGCPRKTQFTPPHEVDRSFPSPLGGNYPSVDSLDSAPQLTSAQSDTPAFSHLQQGYQSVNLGALNPNQDARLTNTTSDHNISGHDADGPQQSGLLKWKGIVFTPEEEDTHSLEESLQGHEEPKSHKPKMVTIELNRGWNSRLGFSLQPQGENTVIKAIYADSVAAKDGRLRVGDVVVKVNGIDVVRWETESVIDLLRKTRGKISVSVLQPV